jgi:hypothetical protein
LPNGQVAKPLEWYLCRSHRPAPTTTSSGASVHARGRVGRGIGASVETTEATKPVSVGRGGPPDRRNFATPVDQTAAPISEMVGTMKSSNPVVPTFFRNEPFDENVEGLSHFWWSISAGSDLCVFWPTTASS